MACNLTVDGKDWCGSVVTPAVDNQMSSIAAGRLQWIIAKIPPRREGQMNLFLRPGSAIAAAGAHGLVLAALVLATGVAGYFLYQEQHADWATVPGGTGVNVKQHVMTLLQKLEDDRGRIRPGARQELLNVTAGDGRRVIFIVNEADIRTTGMDGLELQAGATLVNSVDEYRRLEGTSGLMGTGCGLLPLPEGSIPQQIGDVYFEECKSAKPYFGQGIRNVADIAIVLWKTNSSRPICQSDESADDNGFSKDPIYQKCISGWLQSALKKLFVAVPEVRDSTAIVMPALATGAGRTNPEVTYQAYREVLDDKLTHSDAGSPFPPRVIFLFWRGWPPSELMAHEQAMANLIEELHNSWKEKSAKFRQVGPVATIFGIMCALTFTGFVIVIQRARATSASTNVSVKQFAMTMIGWGFAAQGAAVTAQLLFGRILGSSEFVSFVVGIVAVGLAWLFVLTNKAFGDFPQKGGAAGGAL
jgi:hypothetical protein